MPTRPNRPPIEVNPAKCAGCLTCELRCSLRFEKSFRPAAAAVQVRRLIGQDREFAISFTDRCDSCGICARFCPYECLTQERSAVEVA